MFVGYGIQADRFGHDDYAGIDVKGKIVVMLSGKPTSFPTEEGAHFSSGDHKRSVAARHGAVGIVTLQTPVAEKASPFAKNKEYRFTPSMSWLQPDGTPTRELASMQNRVNLSMPASKKLFSQVDVQARRHLQAGRRQPAAAAHGPGHVDAHVQEERAQRGGQQQRGRHDRGRRPGAEA